MTSTFVNAVKNQSERTQNGMKALKSTANPLVDLYFNIGASRGKDIIPYFVAAFVENKDLATRIALWARDARGGSGERKIFRDIFQYLCVHDVELAQRVAVRIPDLGRWDDLLSATGDVRQFGFQMVREAMQKHQEYLDLLNRIETMSDKEAEKHLASLDIDQSEISS